MSEKRFEINGGTVWRVEYVNGDKIEEELWNPQIVKIMNEQQLIIQQLDVKCKEKEANIKHLHSFLVKKGLAEEFIRWERTVI